MIQKVLEGAGKCAVALLSWEPGQKEEEQELKLTLLPTLHQTHFQLITQILVQTGWRAELPDHCSICDNETFIPQRWNSRSSILVTSSATASKAAKPPGQAGAAAFQTQGTAN